MKIKWSSVYKIEFHKNIPDDLKKISIPDRKTIKKAIERKLTLNPLEFGKPLQYSLKGLRRLRVGDYRVIFLIEKSKKTVFIVKIGDRKDIYRK